MTETKERYVTYEEFNDFKCHDFQEVKDDIKDLRGEVKALTQRVDGIITTLNWYKYIFVLVVLLPFIERLVSRFI
ncbi:hypothetical protein [Weissella cibaria]|uniref:hypothetical protein n=1 Tax=Weissella cibaria TaxID=137591 RepID=UPI0013DAC99F|nr:hypothetical protein [Weissella cibaria]MCA1354978.1 hypothetical protein [Weissella cibaria]MDQ2124692.1 hypothetical protein [Weissella cibaria]MDQ2157870.1 hypothetical protein [Weissella cibaria]NFA01834.1 hypothetical protein [Weissella cibaria]